jgi:tetratricopeptide (TPR) repeat protein
MGEMAKAIADYTSGIELKDNKGLHLLYNNRAAAYNAFGNHEAAIVDAIEAICIDPQFANPYHHRGEARHAQGDTDGALDDLNRAIQLKPDYAAVYHARGTIHDSMGNLAAAVADYKKALELEPGHAKAQEMEAYLRAHPMNPESPS